MRTLLSILALISTISLNSQVEELDLLSQWSDSSIPGSALYNNAYNEVWGFAINGHEYAVLGTTLGTHFFDVTDPENIFEKDFYAGADSGPVIIHRDYHDYNGYLYAVSDEGESTLQIFDISNLPEEISLVYDDNDILERVHNIYIDTTAGKMYACAAKGGDSAYKAVKIYSLEDPTDPQKIGQYGVVGGQSFGHVHDAYVENDTAFFNTGGDGLFVIDFSGDDPELIDYFSSVDYPQAGYNHSGWLTEDKEYYYFADETHGTSMKIVKTNGFNELEIIGTFDAGKANEFSIPHNQIVHDGFLYVSYYYEGIQIFDIADPENPVNVYGYTTSNIDPKASYEGAWGVYPFLPSGNIIVSDMQEGLFVFKCIGENCGDPASSDDIESKELNLFPNPTSGSFSISSTVDIRTITLYSINGEMLGELEGESNIFMLPSFVSDGVYFVEGIANGAIYRSRIVVHN